MKLFVKFLVAFGFFLSLLAGGVANAEMAPDVLVKQTADDVLTIIKNDKERN